MATAHKTTRNPGKWVMYRLIPGGARVDSLPEAKKQAQQRANEEGQEVQVAKYFMNHLGSTYKPSVMVFSAKPKLKGKRNIDPLSAMALMQGTGADTALFGKRGFRELSHTPGKRNPGFEMAFSGSYGSQEIAKRALQSKGITWTEDYHNDVYYLFVPRTEVTKAERAVSAALKQYGRHNPEDIDFLNALAPVPSLGHISFTPDGIERYYRDGFTYQAFSSTPVFADGYRMGAVEGAVSPGLAANPRSHRRNPASEADQLYEDFHGTPPTETLEYHETLHFHAHLGGLADLCHVVVKIIGGSKNGKELQLNAPDPERVDEADVVKLTANEARNQLYFTGGDQALDLKSLGFRESFDVVHDGETFESTEIKDNMVIGYIHRIMYRTEKKFDNFETIDYHHEAGEDTGCLPFLTYDTLNNKMGVAGGSYVIHEKGIVN